MLNPSPHYMIRKIWEDDLPNIKSNIGIKDWKEEPAYYKLSGECFESIYLGINIDAEKKAKIIEVARKVNPNIKIYQMRIDENAFKLIPELIIE